MEERKIQSELLDACLMASENERELLSKAIHNELGAMINVIKLNNSQIKANLKNEHVAAEFIKTNNQLLVEINEKMRMISNELLSPTLLKLGFFKAVKQLCAKFPDTKKAQVSGNAEEIRFEKRSEIHVFRLCKEILTNIIKHSAANEIEIIINFVNEQLFISVRYNGMGIDEEDIRNIIQTNKSTGLKSIYGRMQILGGRINYLKNQNVNEVALSLPAKALVNV